MMKSCGFIGQWLLPVQDIPGADNGHLLIFNIKVQNAIGTQA